MNNSKIMEPYFTIDDFFDTLYKLFEPKNLSEMNDAIIKLFYPPQFGNDEKKKKDVIKWFYIGFQFSVKLINVNYTPYNFKQNQSNSVFKWLYYDRANYYDISMDKRVHVDFKEIKHIFPQQ
jgi:hypothetical protein